MALDRHRARKRGIFPIVVELGRSPKREGKEKREKRKEKREKKRERKEEREKREEKGGVQC